MDNPNQEDVKTSEILILKRRGRVITSKVIGALGVLAILTGLVSYASGMNLPDLLRVGSHKSTPQPTIVVTVNQVTRSCAPSTPHPVDVMLTLPDADASGLIAGQPDVQTRFLGQVSTRLGEYGTSGHVASFAELYAGSPSTAGTDTDYALSLDNGMESALQQNPVFRQAAFNRFFLFGVPRNHIEVRTSVSGLVCTNVTP